MPTKEYIIYYTTIDAPNGEYCAIFKTINTGGVLEAEFKRYLADIDETVDKITSVIPVDKETAVILLNGWQLRYDPKLSGYQV